MPYVFLWCLCKFTTFHFGIYSTGISYSFSQINTIIASGSTIAENGKVHGQYRQGDNLLIKES